MNATYRWIQRECPTNTSVFLFLRCERTDKVLVKKWRYNEGVKIKSGILNDQVDFRLSGKMRNTEQALADCFYIRQC
ncbi:hypothetical protein SAMN05660816_01824 [Niastella yeongjuensis]|nr:hypothetical protein SAMN05660816_01824 [Niastella yeongjuensis]